VATSTTIGTNPPYVSSYVASSSAIYFNETYFTNNVPVSGTLSGNTVQQCWCDTAGVTYILAYTGTVGALFKLTTSYVLTQMSVGFTLSGEGGAGPLCGDNAGNLYLATPRLGGTIKKYSIASGTDTTFSTMPGGYSYHMYCDGPGNLYIASYANNFIYVYNTSGTLTNSINMAGNPSGGTMNYIAVDNTNTYIYVTTSTSYIYRILISTLAATTTFATSGASQFYNYAGPLYGLTFDNSNNLWMYGGPTVGYVYLNSGGNNNTKIPGNGSGSTNGVSSVAKFGYPSGLYYNSVLDCLMVMDQYSGIRQISLS